MQRHFSENMLSLRLLIYFGLMKVFYRFIVGMKVQTKFLSTSLLSISDKCGHMFSLDTRHHDEGKQLIITLDDKNFATIDIIHFSKTREKWKARV